MDNNNNNTGSRVYLVLFLMLIFLSFIFIPTPTEDVKTSEENETKMESESIESVRNIAKEGTYYILNIETLASKDEMYVTVCSVKDENVNYLDRYVFNIYHEPELSKWHSLMCDDIIKYKGNLDFDLVSNKYLDNNSYIEDSDIISSDKKDEVKEK